MTTGATGQLGLALPVQGELSGTWGDTVNNGITQYTNIAIAGTLTLTGDGAVTLANTTGDASASNITSTLTGAGTVTAQFAIVRVTGTLTVAKVVTAPSYSKTYTVVNAATGGIVTFKASGQTGVSVAVGESAFVYFNGTDYVKIVGTATAGAAGGSNTQVQFNSSGILSGSSSLTWDGTTLSSTQVNITGQGTLRLQDTTGGEYVGLRSPSALGSSYTLTFPADDGTSGQALITDGSGVLSWSTAASGDVYGPGSSTDNAVARFDSTTGKLLQNSVVLIGDTGAVTGVTDLAASGSVTLSGGTANGVTYLNGSKVLTSGSALTFDGTNFNVIRSAATDQYMSMYADGTGPTFKFYGGAAGKLAMIIADSASARMQFQNDGDKPFVYSINGSEQMRLTSTGLGIGTSSPSELLTVGAGTASVNSVFYLNGGSDSAKGAGIKLAKAGTAFGYIGAASWMEGGTSNNLAFSATSAATVQMRLDSAGNLGLGVTPSAWGGGFKAFETTGTSFGSNSTGASYYLQNSYYNGTNFIYTTTAAASYYQQIAGAHRWYNAASGTAGNAITFTQAMELNASGGLKTLNTISVGNATPSTSGAGITFPATQSASSNANTLDDYEEGTFSVYLTDGTNNTATASANYTKTGRVVTIQLQIYNATYTGLTAGSTIRISGLPFAPSGACNAPISFPNSSYPTLMTQNPGGTDLFLYTTNGASNTDWQAVTRTLLGGSTISMYASLTYFV